MLPTQAAIHPIDAHKLWSQREKARSSIHENSVVVRNASIIQQYFQNTLHPYIACPMVLVVSLLLSVDQAICQICEVSCFELCRVVLQCQQVSAARRIFVHKPELLQVMLCALFALGAVQFLR